MAKTPRGARNTAQNKQTATKAKVQPAATEVAKVEEIDDSVQPTATTPDESPVVAKEVEAPASEEKVTSEASPAPVTPTPVTPTPVTPTPVTPMPIDRAAAAQARREAAARRSMQLETEMAKVANASENPGLDKLLGNATNLPEAQAQRPAIFDMVDRTVQPFIEEMAPNAAVTDQRAGELHYSMSTLIKYLLNMGGNEMKVGVPYLLSYYRKYKGSVFHPQNHHRGVGAMRGTDADIDFYRNMSRLLVDISNPDDAALVLRRTDIARFRKLTMAITSPAAQKMSENLAALISRVHAR